MIFMKENHQGANLNPAHISSALEYQQASSKSENRATKQMDAGNEPYLINLDAFEMGLHPYIAVYDVGIELTENDDVVLCTASREYKVSPDTVLIWK